MTVLTSFKAKPERVSCAGFAGIGWVGKNTMLIDRKLGSFTLLGNLVVYVEHDDFQETPSKKWFRLAPGHEVRLRYACLIKCERFVKNDAGEVTELICTWDPDSRGGSPKDGRKVKGTLHWVSAAHGVPAESRLYDRLFSVENPGAEKDDFTKHLNPRSLEVLHGSVVEPSLASAKPGERFQFERLGYFAVDADTASRADKKLVFNRTITLKDTWAAIAKKDA